MNTATGGLVPPLHRCTISYEFIYDKNHQNYRTGLSDLYHAVADIKAAKSNNSEWLYHIDISGIASFNMCHHPYFMNFIDLRLFWSIFMPVNKHRKKTVSLKVNTVDSDYINMTNTTAYQPKYWQVCAVAWYIAKERRYCASKLSSMSTTWTRTSWVFQAKYYSRQT